MAYELKVGDIVSNAVFCQAGSQTSVNVFNYLISSVGGAPAELQDFADEFDAAIMGPFTACMSPQATFLGVKSSVYTTGPSPYPAFKTDHNAGTNTGDLLPRAVSGLIQWQTAFSGRSYRGRNFIPFPSEAASDSTGEPTVVYQGKVDDVASAVINFTNITVGFRTADFYLVIWSKQLNETTKVLTASVPLRWSTQHRRGDYGRVFTPPV